ncbi:cytochrome P450 [Nocardia amamiensis]|uniref:cytochrome P450 n=1 Tax=Nocardia amamiensis TaxID=404578 RepID=UPI0009FEFD2B|nr:cytochrome P450 [Nocardia amamiensis]
MTLDDPVAHCPRRLYPFGNGNPHTSELEPEYWSHGPISPVVFTSGLRAWLVTGHDLVRTVLADPRFSREHANRDHVARLTLELLPPAAILANDPPRHTRLRMRIAAMFAPRQVAALEPTVAAAAEKLATRMEAAGGPVELISAYIQPFAAAVICELFGVPDRFREQVFTLGDALTDRDATTEALAEARAECEELTREMAAANPSGVFAMLGESAEADDEVVNLVIACLIGGRGSPTIFLSSAVLALLRDRARYQLLADNPGAIPVAVEELLRMVPVGISGGFTRVATADVQLGPVLVRAGDAVVPATIAAGRDPAVFDRPDELVLDRDGRARHLAFGHGTHFCIGASLARMEARIALTQLVSRFPSLHLGDAENGVVWRHGRVNRALERLEVAWTPR